MAKEKKTERMQIKIEPSLKALAQAQAVEEYLSLSQYVIELIKKDVQKRKQG